MKKKTVSIMVAATMALSLFAGCGSSKDTATEDTSKTESTETTDESSENASAETTDESSRTTFTVGFDAEYPPYGYMDDDGEYTGFDLELAQAVCDKEGWELVKKPINWDSKDMELNSGSIDCIWNGFTMNGREDDYTFSVPYVDNSQVIVVAEDSGIEQLSDLAGKTVDFVNKSAMNGTILAHTDGSVPNLMVKIPAQDAYSLGQLFYFFEFACGVSGYILGVNPFNQPGVESYKKNMFALLGKPGYEEAREALLKRL